MTRTRSEYRMSPIPVAATAPSLETSHPLDSHRDALAALLLDAYRDTIDDEGEDLDDAYEAIDHYLAGIIRPHSFVLLQRKTLVAFSFVLVVDEVHYVDPVVVTPVRKRQGLGRAAVQLCLDSLAGVEVPEVGATITDGNLASERLFIGLGFTRHGVWA
jgi:GNAT superfamily N-acetyltransferase